MRPIRVKTAPTRDDPLEEALWVACDNGVAVVIIGRWVYRVSFEALEVLENVPCDEKGSSVFVPSSGSKEPAADASVTSTAGPAERVRKRRRKRASSLRGPRSNQWKPEEMA